VAQRTVDEVIFHRAQLKLKLAERIIEHVNVEDEDGPEKASDLAKIMKYGLAASRHKYSLHSHPFLPSSYEILCV
jgi:hypothetical protein